MKYVVDIPDKDADALYDIHGDGIAVCDAIAEVIRDAFDIKKVKVTMADFK